MLAEVGLWARPAQAGDVFTQTCLALGLGHESLVVMLEAYFDESGTHGDRSDAVSVGGFLASREQWEAFSLEWKALLERESIKVFHRVDLECFQKEFKRENGWDEARRDRVVNEAQTIIGKHVQIGFVHSVIKSHYDEVITDDSVRRRLGRHYYTFCAQACMRKIAVWAAFSSHNEAISYFFEDGARGSGELYQLMSRITKRKAVKAVFRYRGLSFFPKYDETVDGVLFPGVVQLQSADLLAYEGFKLMENRFTGSVRRPIRKSMLHLLGLPFPIESNYHEREGLIELDRRVKNGELTYP
ncbi:MAG: hypothetical protein ND895_22360 [Pyrinomonadaceae bacterium]|nr:hypothetical protein [Pyrinomonadaceae bacterium]